MCKVLPPCRRGTSSSSSSSLQNAVGISENIREQPTTNSVFKSKTKSTKQRACETRTTQILKCVLCSYLENATRFLKNILRILEKPACTITSHKTGACTDESNSALASHVAAVPICCRWLSPWRPGSWRPHAAWAAARVAAQISPSGSGLAGRAASPCRRWWAGHSDGRSGKTGKEIKTNL